MGETATADVPGLPEGSGQGLGDEGSARPVDSSDVPSLLRRARTVGLIALCLGPGGLVALAGMQAGAFFAGTTAQLSLLVAGALLLRILLSGQPLGGLNVRLGLAGTGLAAFAAWLFVSGDWSHAPSRALVEYDRVLLYALVLILFGSLGRTVLRTRLMVYGVAAASAGLCIVGLLSRTLPDLLQVAPTYEPERLSFPLTYWNALGLLAAGAIVLCGHLTCSDREPPATRLLGAAALPAVATTLFFTFSRGSVAVAMFGVVLYAVVSRPRALLAGAVATIPPAVGALFVAKDARALASPFPSHAAAISQGHRVAIAVAVATVVAFLLRGAVMAITSRLPMPKRRRRVPRRIVAGAVAVVLVAAVTTGLALAVPARIVDGYHAFMNESPVPYTKGASRLTSLANNGRVYHWLVSLRGYRAHPWNGTGAGTYQTEWTRLRPATFASNDGHSLYLETLGELGLPGLILVVFTLLVILGGMTTRIRGPDRALYGAIFAAGVAWALHAGIDWDWEIPAVTLAFFALGGAANASAPTRRPLRISSRLTLAGRAVGVAICAGLALVPLHLRTSQTALDRAVAAHGRRDCRTAARSALDSVAAVNSRPEPFEILAWCDGEAGHPKAGAQMAAAAVRRDPDAWGFSYELAVLRARAGQDPSRAARAAISLNRRGERVAALRRLLRAGDAKAWRRLGGRLPLNGAQDEAAQQRVPDPRNGGL